MISTYWLLVIVPCVFCIGHVIGYNRCMRVQRLVAGRVRKLIAIGHGNKAIRYLNVVEGISTRKQQQTFIERMKELGGQDEDQTS